MAVNPLRGGRRSSSPEWNKFCVSVLCPACASAGPCVLIPVPFPCGSVWIAACFGFVNDTVGAQCVIILRDIIAVLASVTRFPLHSAHAGSLPRAPEVVASLSLTCVMGQLQNPRWQKSCYWVQPLMSWSLA